MILSDFHEWFVMLFALLTMSFCRMKYNSWMFWSLSSTFWWRLLGLFWQWVGWYVLWRVCRVADDIIWALTWSVITSNTVDNPFLVPLWIDVPKLHVQLFSCDLHTKFSLFWSEYIILQSKWFLVLYSLTTRIHCVFLSKAMPTLSAPVGGCTRSYCWTKWSLSMYCDRWSRFNSTRHLG